MNALPKRLPIVRAIALAGALAFGSVGAIAQAEKPQPGGTLNVGLVYYTLSPLSWDPADWAWKFGQDTGLMYEQLFVGDLSKAKSHGGKLEFTADSWLPTDAIRGELAESWKTMDNPFRVEVKLRKGVMFPDKPGVMKSRELVAQDVVDTFYRLDKSPKKIPTYYDHVDKVEAPDKHTVLFTFKNYNAEWDYRFGWGYYSGIVPKEVADAGAKDWKNANGTGPFQLTDYVQGNAATFSKNPVYWDKQTVGGQSYKLPFVDKIVYRTIKDEATMQTALRTGKIDILESIRWSAVEELKKSAPALKWKRWVNTGGVFVAMRVDTKPFDDIRVRRALNMAVNKQEIVQSFYGGNAEVFAFPQHPDYGAYFEPLDKMPDSIKELYTYNPDKAKKLLTEAGHPNGFTFKAHICACDPIMMDLGPMVAAYLEKIGVKMQFEPLEQGAFFSLLRAGKNHAGMAYTNSHGGPTTTLRKNFMQGQYTNNAQWNDTEFEKKMRTMYRERDEGKRQQMVREMTREIVDKAPYIFLPVAYTYAAWWPWVKNYDGEIYAGGFWWAPVHARIWIDQDLKKKMGF